MESSYTYTQLFPADSPAITMHRRKIRLIEGNAKCRHLKKLTLKGALQQVFICLWPRKPYPPPPLTHCILVYSTLIHTAKGGGGRVDPERRLEEQPFTKQGRKYKRDWLYLQSINSDKHLPQKHFVLMSIYLLSPCHAQTKNKKSCFVGARHRVEIGLSYRPARLHRLAELMPLHRFLGSTGGSVR